MNYLELIDKYPGPYAAGTAAGLEAVLTTPFARRQEPEDIARCVATFIRIAPEWEMESPAPPLSEDERDAFNYAGRHAIYAYFDRPGDRRDIKPPERPPIKLVYSELPLNLID